MPVIEEGLDSAEKVAEAASSFHRVDFLRIKDKQTVYLRFVTERTATFGMHMGAPTKPKPKEVKSDKWPKLMWAVCQNDKPFRLRDADGTVLDEFEEGMGDCHLHKILRGKKDDFGKDKSIARVQTFGLAALREPVTDPDTGAVIGFKNVTEEFRDSEGVARTIAKLVIVQQTFSNFWAPLKHSMFMGPKTLCDKDFEITRKDKEYLIGGGVSDPELVPGRPKWKVYEDALQITGFDLVPQLLEWASPNWYKRWFIEGATPEGGYGRQGDDDEGAGESAGDDGEAAEIPSEEGVAGFRDILKNARSAAAAPASASAELPF